MKKQFLLIAFVAISSAGLAQTTISAGIRAGISSSSMRGDAVENLHNLLDFTKGAITTSGHTGFFAGVNASIPVSDAVSIEPGLYYTQKGYEMKGELNLKGVEFLGVNAKAKLNSYYVDLPLLLKVNLNGFQVFAGPQISYLAKAD
jgi:hypothetical protein